MTRLWNVAPSDGGISAAKKAEWKAHQNWVTSIAFSPDGKLLAISSFDHKVKLWDASEGKHYATLARPGCTIWCVTFSRDGKTLYCGTSSQPGKEDTLLRCSIPAAPVEDPEEIALMKLEAERKARREAEALALKKAEEAKKAQEAQVRAEAEAKKRAEEAKKKADAARTAAAEAEKNKQASIKAAAAAKAASSWRRLATPCAARSWPPSWASSWSRMAPLVPLTWTVSRDPVRATWLASRACWRFPTWTSNVWSPPVS